MAASGRRHSNRARRSALARDRWRHDFTMIHRRVDQALDLSLQHHLQGGALDVGIVAGIDHQQHFVARPRRILRPLDDLAGVRRDRDLIRDQPDRVRGAAFSGRAPAHWAPSKLFDGRPDPIAGFLWNVGIGTSLTTKETVVCETPAARATSYMEGGRRFDDLGGVATATPPLSTAALGD